MQKPVASGGYFPNGVPYNQVGHGPGTLLIFQRLFFDNRPLPASMVWLYRSYFQYLAETHTTYIVHRKTGMPAGYSLPDMADDYATVIEEMLGGPVDIMGSSTGGSIALHFAADHPDLVRKLILHSSAHSLNARSKQVQLEVGELARQRRWPAAYAKMVSLTRYSKLVIWIGALLAGTFGVPKDPSDVLVTIAAEDQLNFKDRLGQITAPTLVIAGEQDPFYSPTLFRETAVGIPRGQLILYPGMGHPAAGKQFRQDVLRFLKEEPAAGEPRLSVKPTRAAARP